MQVALPQTKMQVPKLVKMKYMKMPKMQMGLQLDL